MAISNLSGGLRSGVCTSTTRPTTPYEGQMIYETDTDKVLVWNGSAWYANWNLPWGFVAETTLANTSSNYITAEQDVLSLTFTSIASRKYRYTASGLIVNSGTGHISINFVNASNVALREYYTYFAASTNSYQMGFFDYQESITTAGSVTRKVRHPASTPGVLYYGANTRDSIAWKIRVEDIGPA